MNHAIDTETLSLPGLKAACELRIDRWGISHIRADNQQDLFFAQGVNAARDRLWQLDLWRKRGLGLLAADFGPGYLAQDHAARHFLFRGDMAAEWRAYAEDAREICTAFVAGINAWIALCERQPERLPPEFALFGTQPARWLPEDVVRIRTHALTRNAASEILRANVLARSDAATDLLRAGIAPPVEPQLADGLSAADIPLEALKLFKLATAPVSFADDRLNAALDQASAWSEVTDLGDIVRAVSEEGSNNWVVHGSRTASGRPLLASDPHRAHAAPSLRYLVHLHAPGFNAIGAGEPSAPGISLGHNGQTAFGLTIFGADQEDVYVYQTRPGDADRYRYQDGWQPIERVEESFAVKGHAPQTLPLAFTRHGPILFEDPARQRAIALRSVWLSPGAAAYLGSLSAMRAASVAEFGAALASWGTPSVNHVCADAAGNIGWFTAGFTPVRHNWHGLLPVPGDGRYEWDGYLPADRLPHSINPPAGFFATANEMNIPADRDADAPSIGHEWAEGSRAARIKQVLADDRAHSITAAQALQNDTFSLPAQRLCRLLAQIERPKYLSAPLRQATRLLADWDYKIDADSAPAALFEVWWMKHLRPALLARLAPDPELRLLLQPGDLDSLLQLIETPDGRFGDNAERARNRLIFDSLSAAGDECRRHMGEKARQWRWGRLHQTLFEHAVSRTRHGTDRQWNTGPLPLGGSRSTPMLASYRINDFMVTAGASVRLVIDVGDWDNSVCINAPGQSGDPRSAHYRDLARPWSKGEYVPLLYSEDKITAHTRQRIVLQPG
ncbi:MULTISPECIES: penicillin acylase family protein [unclassified Brenneria]|uniref:penicillin acylase family protein n=1 Tax=unclassified Brenneria TaxID=2634434 RepID=UPI0029C36FFB|nr:MULTISPECIES: penicillin acylase family protein [unclassified Brenneria]MDX5630210.1 penicillin acylase family protein [Brenneria sp. L3-3Z]MDX5697355.1 penicillin acylase family protein [Brenneria sp. L4-2C]